MNFTYFFLFSQGLPKALLSSFILIGRTIVILVLMTSSVDGNELLRVAPVLGKTYSLFGQHKSTIPFYEHVNKHLTTLQKLIPDNHDLLVHLQSISKNRRKFNDWRKSDPQISAAFSELVVYLTDLNEHLKQRPCYRLRSGALSTMEHQYLTYFLEFELVNRMNREKFLQTRFKLALLPHCIRISIPGCKARSDGLDLVCTKCSKGCYIREITEILHENNIKAYIWMEMNFGPTTKLLQREFKTLGILGIACIPELISGMRKCLRYGLPVIGLPLNANRCIRWMGDFYPNSMNLEKLRSLVSE